MPKKPPAALEAGGLLTAPIFSTRGPLYPPTNMTFGRQPSK